MTPAPTRWLVGPRFDLRWLFGGAALSLIVAAVVLSTPTTIVALWWVWLLAFDGPHMMAAYTRTYLDPAARKTRRGLLLGSLACLAVGPLCLLLNIITKRQEPFLLFLALATAYGYHHLVRQHYGFIALYSSKAGQRSKWRFAVDKWVLYVGCWTPYVYFLLTNAKARQVMELGPEPLSAGFSTLLIGLWLACFAAIAINWLRTPRAQRSIPKLVYSVLAIGLHGFAYLLVGRYEPVYAASQGPDQDFLLLSMVLTIFHNVQYVALVYLHNQSRYTQGGHGLASWLSKSAGRFLLVCFGFSAIYLLLAALTGVFPLIAIGVGATLGGVSLNQLGLAVWWGLALHHYILDQYIWRIGDDPELRKHLSLN